MAPKRKLIEVSIPLEAINRESAREKSIRYGHPSTLHLWWARRPLAAARAVLFAQLVDDPSSHPEKFSTIAAQDAERERLHDLMRELVLWENVSNEAVLGRARAEILMSFDGEAPTVLDPFAGGGTIPLEAKRLGLLAEASDLNPLPVLINTVMLELVDRFSLTKPLSGGMSGTATEIIADDLRYYAQRLSSRVSERVGASYPNAADGSSTLAYFWARTVACPNPTCRARVPLVNSWVLDSRPRSMTYLSPVLREDLNEFRLELVRGGREAPRPTMRRTGGECPSCWTAISLDYVKTEGVDGRIGAQMLATLQRYDKSKYFAEASDIQVTESAVAAPPTEWLEPELSTHSQYMAPPRYGLTRFRDLFTSRQLSTLSAFVDELDGIHAEILSDASGAGMSDEDRSFDEGGSGAAAYADALKILLALGVSRLVNRQSTLCIWDAQRQTVQQVFARQAYSMTWFFAEANPFNDGSGSWSGQIDFLARAIAALPEGRGNVRAAAAQELPIPDGIIVSTDPPYYDNVPYADLSDYFIVWLRRMLQQTVPYFSTMLSPKNDELVADHVRHGGRASARDFFESGMSEVFSRLGVAHRVDTPMTVYYAFKQEDQTAEGAASSGWETLIEALLKADWSITGTWPLRTEQPGGLREVGRNALASSVVVVCQRRAVDAAIVDRRGFIAALRSELGIALRELQTGGIAPVDLPQAAIGPGMAVFSRYARVIEADGSPMTVRSALAQINEVLDEVLNQQEGDFDETTRFAIVWYRGNGYTPGRFGMADDLARARNTAVETMERHGILTARAGRVQLIRPLDLTHNYDISADTHPSEWEALHHAIRLLESDGIPSAGRFLRSAIERPERPIELNLIKELAYLLFQIAEKNGWTKDALSFNALATSWSDISDSARSQPAPSSTPTMLDLEDLS